MRAIAQWALLVALAAGGPAAATGVAVRVVDSDGPVADAVVGLVPADGVAAAPATRLPAVASVDQRDLTFVPYVQVVRPGGGAVFRNSDRTRHHVYSFSPAATFEMVLGPGERSGRVPLARPGVVAVGCNIHDQMIAWLYVSDAPWLARTGADGVARLRGVPAGRYRLQVWHPRLDARGDLIERNVVIHAGSAPRSLVVPVRLRPDVRGQPDPERAAY